MKNIIFFLLFAAVSPVYAEDVNLVCDLTYKEDNQPTQKIKTRVEITYYKNGDVFIIPDSSFLASVSTAKLPTTTSVTNFSNSSKWHVTRVGGNPANSGISNTTIIIDRNAGSISYSQIFTYNGNSINSSGFGYCEKINPNVKKF
jgi:hypothetical protein